VGPVRSSEKTKPASGSRRRVSKCRGMRGGAGKLIFVVEALVSSPGRGIRLSKMARLSCGQSRRSCRVAEGGALGGADSAAPT
jgi:hypothetical protein